MRGLIGDLRIKTYLVNQNPAETCQVFGKKLFWTAISFLRGTLSHQARASAPKFQQPHSGFPATSTRAAFPHAKRLYLIYIPLFP
jgi:hypothetical protein